MSMAMVGAVLLFGVAAYAAGSAHLFAPSPLAAADSGCQTFTQTGHTVCGDFLVYWQTNGGLAQQGYPISDVFNEKSETDGITHKVQYFERAVFEAHPENQPPNNVLLSLLGSQKYKVKYPNGASASASTTVASPQPASATSANAAPAATTVPASTYPLRKVNGRLAITLYQIRDPSPVRSGESPKAGTRVVAIDVTMENTGSDAFDYNAFEWYAQTTDDRVYEAAGFESALDPYLTSGSLAAGEKARGWISFVIPQGNALSTVKYGDFGSNPIVYSLG
ncbi:MAG: DUF4352 domain-containing protein [Thermomicrobiales bacterium]